MGHLCFGSYTRILLYKAAPTTLSNKKLCGLLLKVFDDYYDITEDDETVSKLLSGSQNIAPDIVRAAATIDPHLVEQYFEREIIHRLNPNKKKHIVLALKELILTDSDIAPETQLGTLSDMKKAALQSKTAFAFTEFLTDVFLYAVKNTDNRVDKKNTKAEEEKRFIEDEVRAHLRGFARTIPSFIMAYGDGNLTLANFDDKTEDDVFLEVTGITEAEFRFLRDGGEYTDPETGEVAYFEGHLFDEVVFDDSIKEFWAKKQELANYFDEAMVEDIFDYIPPQKTNQIFTPKWVVKKMVDELEEKNPGCFDDPNKTFADLYMKSGLYITEIVKRLFRSEKMKEQIPDDGERIRHILRKQVYGMAPTRIIYLIATNYILGFDEELKSETSNFVQADAAEAAKNDTLTALVARYFG